MFPTETLGLTGNACQPNGFLFTELACRPSLFGTLGFGTGQA